MPLQEVNSEMVALLRPFFMDNTLERDSDTYNDTAPKVFATDADGGARIDHLEVGNITGATEGDVAASGFFRLGPGSILTIAAGVVTAVGSFHYVDTEGGAATDDLATINVAAAANYAILVLMTVSSARDVVVKDGTGNIQLAGGDFTLNTFHDTIMLFNRNGSWYELGRSDNA